MTPLLDPLIFGGTSAAGGGHACAAALEHAYKRLQPSHRLISLIDETLDRLDTAAMKLREARRMLEPVRESA